jgi:hypothetical protein
MSYFKKNYLNLEMSRYVYCIRFTFNVCHISYLGSFDACWIQKRAKAYDKQLFIEHLNKIRRERAISLKKNNLSQGTPRNNFPSLRSMEWVKKNYVTSLHQSPKKQ